MTIRPSSFVGTTEPFGFPELCVIGAGFAGLLVVPRCKDLGHYLQGHLVAAVAHLHAVDRSASNRLLAYRFVEASRRSFHLEISPKAQEAARVASALAHVRMSLPRAWATAAVKQFARSLQRGKIALSPVIIVPMLSGLQVLARIGGWRYGRRRMFLSPDAGLELDIRAEQPGDWSNRINLSDRAEALGVRQARIDWEPKSEDERTFGALVPRLGPCWCETGPDRVCAIEWSAAIKNKSLAVIDAAKAMFHPSCTTRRGLDPRSFVVDEELRYHQVPNVMIASAFLFPISGSANLTFTIRQIALRTADALPRRDRGGRRRQINSWERSSTEPRSSVANLC